MLELSQGITWHVELKEIRGLAIYILSIANLFFLLFCEVSDCYSRIFFLNVPGVIIDDEAVDEKPPFMPVSNPKFS